MPYALIPDGYTLKKVTKDQKQAVDDLQWREALKGFTGSNNSSIFLIVALGTVGYVALSQFKMPTFSLTQSFANAFPQFSAFLGITRKGTLSPEKAAILKRYLTEGALAVNPDAPVLQQYIFPTPQQKEDGFSTGPDLSKYGF